MVTTMHDPTTSLRPPLAPGDVYVYAHGSGAISVLHADETWWPSTTLADARRAVVDANRAGATAWVAGDDAPLAVDTLVALGGDDLHLEPYVPPGAPQEWERGASPIMTAIQETRFDLVRDLVHRGADVHQTMEGGLTALHFAAAVGDEATIRLLLDAGADPNAVTDEGLDPHAVALTYGRDDNAALLPSTIPIGSARRIDFFAGVGFCIVMLAVVALIIGSSDGGISVGAVAGSAIPAALAVVGAVIAVDALRWPNATEIRGADLIFGGPLGTARTIDLTRATEVASTRPVRTPPSRFGPQKTVWSVLVAHPDGRRLPERVLRRHGLPEPDIGRWLDSDTRFVVIALTGENGVAPTEALARIVRGHGGQVHPSVYATVAANPSSNDTAGS